MIILNFYVLVWFSILVCKNDGSKLSLTFSYQIKAKIVGMWEVVFLETELCYFRVYASDYLLATLLYDQMICTFK